MLRAVVAEVLRLYPPAYALFLRHAVNGVELGSLSIRKGDLVQTTPFTLQRDGRWFVEPEFSLPPRSGLPMIWRKIAKGG